MRAPLFVVVLALAGSVHADRLISVPTARKLLDGSVRLESLRQFGPGGYGTDYLAAGLGPSWEAEARLLERGDRDSKLTGDVTYNVLAPLTGFAPGLAIGVQDVAAATSTGLRAFACATVRNGFDHGNVPFDVTVGMFVGRRSTPYVGTSVPLYFWLRLLAESDGLAGKAALEATPLRGLRLRLVGERGRLLGSFGYTVKFR